MTTDWPLLPLAEWVDTRDTLHMWTQVVGKVCLASTPPLNHFWNVTLRVRPRGLSTPTLFHGIGPSSCGSTSSTTVSSSGARTGPARPSRSRP